MKKLIILLSLFCFVICPAFADEVIDDCYDMAKNYFDSGDYTSALEYANHILTTNPDHYGASYIKIKLTPPQQSLGKTNLTKSVFVKKTNGKIGDTNSDNYNALGEKYLRDQDYTNAKKNFKLSLKYDWNNYYTYNNLGLLYWDLKDYKKAESAFKHAIYFKRDFSIAYDNLAQLYIEQNNYPLAHKVILKALSETDKDFISFYLCGLSNKKMNHYTDAAEDFNHAINVEPTCVLPYLQLADTYYLSKDFEWSNSTLDKYSELNPNDS